MSPPLIQRLKYFTGQFLEKDDFIDEQNYHVDMRQRGNRALYFSAGILDDGFQVETVAGDLRQIRVSAGTAVDAKGQELVVLDPLLSTAPIPVVDGQRYLVALAYHQFEDRQQSTGDVNLTDTTRYVELPELKWYLDTDNFDRGLWVVVAAVRVKLDGSVSAIDLGRSVRAYAGARVPGRLGVGTSAPQQALSVLGGLNLDQANANNGTLGSGGLSFGDGSGEGLASTRTANSPNQFGLDLYARGLPRLSVLNDGRVGIGTREPVANAILHLLGGSLAITQDATLPHADASLHIVGVGGRLTQMFSKVVTTDALNLIGTKNAGSGEQWWAWGATTANKWRVRSGTDLGGDNGLSIDASGRVGIGTSSPLAALNIPATGLQLGFSATASDNFHFTSDLTGNRRGLRLWNGNYGAGSHILTATAPGWVGVGVLDPAAQLHVGGAGGGSIDLIVNGRLKSDNNDGGLWISDNRFVGGVDTDKLGLYAGNAWRLTVLNDGKVGVGTTTPAARLSVVAGGASELSGVPQSVAFRVAAGVLGVAAGTELGLASVGFHSGNNTSLGIRARRFSNGTDWQTTAIGLGIDVDNTLRINDASLWLHPAGRVGISTSTPQQKLDVNGSAIIRGAMQITGNAGLVNLEGTDHAFIQWFPKGGTAGRMGYLGYGDPASTSFTIQNDGGRMHIAGAELLYLLNKGGVVVSKAWAGGSSTAGNLTVENEFHWAGDQSTAGHIRIGDLLICWGRLTLSLSTNTGVGSAEVDQPVGFPATFQGTPSVVVSIDDPGFGRYFANTVVGALRASSTGFTATAKRIDLAGNSAWVASAVVVSWMAIGVGA